MNTVEKWARVGVTLFASMVSLATSVPWWSYLSVDRTPSTDLAAVDGALVFHHPTRPWLRVIGSDVEDLTDGVRFSFVVQNTTAEPMAVSTKVAELRLGTERAQVENGVEETLSPGDSRRFMVCFDSESLATLAEVPDPHSPRGAQPEVRISGRVRLATFTTPSGGTTTLEQDVSLVVTQGP